MSKNGLIVYDKETPCTVRFDQAETLELTGQRIDFSKYDEVCEVAHLEISASCNMKCKYCYVGHKGGKELSTDNWKKILDELAASGIFQVSFGGGEPTLRKDLFQIAKYVRLLGMNLGMTTNGIDLHRLNPKHLKAYFNQINVSWHQNPEVVERALAYLDKHDIPRGINYCFSKPMSKDNDVVKFLAETFHAEILYLVYKPVIKDTKNQIVGEEVYKVAKEAANEGLRVAVDGPCVNKCLAKQKFVDIDSSGYVFPCSFIRKPIGNLLVDNFKDIWKNRGQKDECPYVNLEKE